MWRKLPRAARERDLLALAHRSETPACPAPTPGINRLTFQLLPREPEAPPPPEERFSQELIAFHRPGHALGEQYRSLAAALAVQLPAGQPHVLLFAAATNGIDTTTVMLNLGITFAKQSKCVVIVDANLQHPTVGEQFGMSQAPGLRDVLAGSFSLHRAVRETGLENLFALTAGKAQGKVIPVGLPTFVIGRDPGCYLRPTTPFLSKRPCALLVRPDKVFLRGLDSTNDTFLNGRQVKGEVAVLDGHRLRSPLGSAPRACCGGTVPYSASSPPRHPRRAPA